MYGGPFMGRGERWSYKQLLSKLSNLSYKQAATFSNATPLMKIINIS
jgi:hypothetical protein